MKRSRYTETQIVKILKDRDAGRLSFFMLCAVGVQIE